MLEFLFGWITKPEIMQTPIDKLIGVSEFIIFSVLVITVIAIFLTIKENAEEKRKEKRNGKSSKTNKR